MDEAWEGRFTRALAKHQAGDLGGAAQLYRDFLKAQPDNPDALHMLGVIAQQLNQSELALRLIQAALTVKPEMGTAWHNQALVLRVLGRLDEALESEQHALALNPSSADSWDMAGALLSVLGKEDEALLYHEKALELQPDNSSYRSHYATLLMKRGRLFEAYKALRVTEKQDDNFPPMTLGNLWKASGFPERAIPCFQKTHALLPNLVEAQTSEAMAWLQMGDMEQGWELMEKRKIRACFESIPLWKGEKVQHLLLHEDQGLGDALQFIRYLPLIRDRAEHITLQVSKPLQRIMADNFPTVSVLNLDDPVPPADARCQLMGLAYLLKTRLETIPASVPYLKLQETETLASLSKPRIGLVWGGNPDHLNDRNRSVHFSQLKPILQEDGASFVSLQKGAQMDQADFAALNIFNAAPWLNDFTATAGLLAELDLLITVDTSIAHLAGAMGKPVWLLTPFDPDWRWFLGREDSPWYPTMRLFRQTKPRAWEQVIEKITEELRRLIKGDLSVLEPRRWTGAPLRQNPDGLRFMD